MLDALYLGSHNWISHASIVSTPLSCFPFVQELLLILHCKVVCIVDSLFRRLSSPIFQVSLVFVPGTLNFSFRQQECRRVFSRHVGRGGGGGGGGGFLGPMGSCAFSPFYQFGMTAWN